MKHFGLAICSLLLYGGMLLPAPASAVVYTDPTKALDAVSGTSTKTPLTTIIKNILNAFFGILGIIAVLLVIWSGFQWMTGGADGVGKAKERLKNAAIGLLLILVAYSLTNYVIKALTTATK